ncbi:hypothetical protein JHK87_052236 [Glycine soja]|nr:hypothetical protein JHK87_052236 [Glycine soja]
MDVLTCILMFSLVTVDIPPWFSAVSISLNSDVDLNAREELKGGGCLGELRDKSLSVSRLFGVFLFSVISLFTMVRSLTPFHQVLGNHDYRGDVEAQLNPILQKIDPRWICQRSFIVDTEIAEFFFIDSTPFVDQYFLKPKDHKYDWRGVLPREKYLSKLLKDLEIALKDSTAKWKIVVGHHPIRSIGHHGDTKELIRQLLPILEMLIMNLMLCDVLIHDSKIEQCEKDKERVLVHCMSGKSRSLAIVIAYLMKSKGWRLVHSYQWVKEWRPSVELTQAACMTWELAESGDSFITSIINGADLVPTIHWGRVSESAVGGGGTMEKGKKEKEKGLFYVDIAIVMVDGAVDGGGMTQLVMVAR